MDREFYLFFLLTFTFLWDCTERMFSVVLVSIFHGGWPTSLFISLKPTLSYLLIISIMVSSQSKVGWRRGCASSRI